MGKVALKMKLLNHTATWLTCCKLNEYDWLEYVEARGKSAKSILKRVRMNSTVARVKLVRDYFERRV